MEKLTKQTVHCIKKFQLGDFGQVILWNLFYIYKNTLSGSEKNLIRKSLILERKLLTHYLKIGDIVLVGNNQRPICTRYDLWDKYLEEELVH